MEIYIIVGYRDMEFKSQSGDLITGRKYYYTYVQNGVTGVACDSFFVTKEAMANLAYVPNVDDEVEVYFNRYGKVSQIRECR